MCLSLDSMQADWRKIRKDCRFIRQLSCSTARDEIGEDLDSVM